MFMLRAIMSPTLAAVLVLIFVCSCSSVNSPVPQAKLVTNTHPGPGEQPVNVKAQKTAESEEQKVDPVKKKIDEKVVVEKKKLNEKVVEPKIKIVKEEKQSASVDINKEAPQKSDKPSHDVNDKSTDKLPKENRFPESVPSKIDKTTNEDKSEKPDKKIIPLPQDPTNRESSKPFIPYNMLVVLPMPFYSHSNNFMPVFKALARKGHNITILSPFPQKDMQLPNWREIIVPNTFQRMLALMPETDFTKMNGIFHKTVWSLDFANTALPIAFEMEELMDLYRDTSTKYDVVFIEAQFVQEPLIAFGHQKKAPVIAMYSTHPSPEVSYYTGNPVFTSTYVPSILSDYSNKMTFVERIMNTVLVLLKVIFYGLVQLPQMDKLMRRNFPSSDLPYIGDMLSNISFTLVDSNLLLDYPLPRANNMREFLGSNAQHSTTMPPEIQEFVDSAPNGVVLFTLGSIFQPSNLRAEVLKSLMTAFSRLPVKFIMKWDLDTAPPDMPDNVMVSKWLPQPAILAHEKCLAFVTHAGAHGLAEAVYHGVPVITVPLFADQLYWAKWVETSQLGRVIDIHTVTEDTAFEVLRDVIFNSRYKENMVTYSGLLKDKPISPLDDIIYWVEFVIKTKGAPMLRPGSLDLSWYQRFGIDIIALAILLIAVSIRILSFCVKFVLKLTRKSSSGKKKKE